MTEGLWVLIIVLGIIVLAVVFLIVPYYRKKEDKQVQFENEIGVITGLMKNEDGNLDKIIEHLDKLLEIAPQSIDALNGKAKYCFLKYQKNNDKRLYRQALEYYDKSLSIEPDNLYTMMSKAHVMTNWGDIQPALACYDKIIDIDPSFFDAWHAKAKTMAILGADYYLETKKTYDHILESFDFTSGKEAVLFEKIRFELDVLNKTGEGIEEAVADLDKLGEMSESENEINFLKGLAYHYSGADYYDQAMLFYNKTIETCPDDDAAWVNKGILFLDAGNYEEALKYLNKAVELNPGEAVTWFNLGIAYEKTGNQENALDCYDRATALDPELKYSEENKSHVLENGLWDDDPYKLPE